MQSESFYTLKQSKVAWFAHFICLSFYQLSQIWGKGEMSVVVTEGVCSHMHIHNTTVEGAQTLYI